MAKSNNLVPLTPDQRAVNQEKARLTRQLKAQVRTQVRNDYADMGEWERLAREAGLRLPPPGTKITSTVMRRWFRKIGISARGYYAWSGERSLGEFVINNPRWSARAWAGLCLENRDLIVRFRSVC